MKHSEIAVVAVAFLVSTAITALWYTIPLVFSNLLDYNYALVSIILAAIPFVEIIGAIPIGFYVDNGAAKSIGAVGTMFLILTPVVFVVFSGVGFIDMVLLGIGSITTEISLEAYAFNIVKNVKIKYIGAVSGLSAIGALLGASAGGFLFQYYSLWYLLAFLSGLLLAALIIFIKYLEPIRAAHSSKVERFNKIIKEEGGLYRKFRHFITSLSIFSFLFGFFEWGIWLLIPLIIIIRSADIFYGGIIYGLICLPFGFGSFLASHVYKRHNKRKIVFVSILASVAAMLLTSSLLAASAYVLVLLVFTSFSISVAYLALSGYVLEKDRKDIAEFYVFETVSYDAGGIFGILLGGFTVILTSITTVAVVFSVVAVAFLAYFFVVSRDVQ